jgi:Family of unknown function (DUF6657)
MAEIRSTLDMVMERAERMANRAADVPMEQQMEERGMRLLVEFMNGNHPDLNALLQAEDPAVQMPIRKGMATGILRNIVLPRDEDLLKSSAAALTTIQQLAEQDAEISSICTELSQILDQYTGHKDQLKQQLADNIRTQLAQQLQQQTGEMPDLKSIDPTMHPQYQKEWDKARSDLNDQYAQALEQRKDILLQRFSQ